MTRKDKFKLISIRLAILIFLCGLWAGAVSLRNDWIKPLCSQSPSPCTKDSINFIDRWTVNYEIGFFDWLSFRTQDLAILISIIIPVILIIKSGKILRSKHIHNLYLTLQIICVNGFLTEVARITVQRPRPFVYKDPAQLGLDPAHYTSFYSGHTSFVTAALTASFISNTYQMSSTKKKWLSIFYILIVLTTAVGRIFSGRHFLTDTLAAMIFGFLTALVIFKTQNKNE